MTKHTIKGTSENTFEEQGESDPIIEDLEVTVDALREELHLFASNKGNLVGEITLVDSGDTIDARRMGSGGWGVPSIVEAETIQFKKHEAKFILLVEKDAVFRRLNEDRFWKKHHCILIHGGGQPPRGVRRLVHRLHRELKLPVFVLVDNDPWGFYIYSVVKQGSINLAYESMRMAVPEARFVGLSSFDKKKYGLPDNVTIKLTDDDERRAKQMLAYPWFEKKQWQKEIEGMMKSGVKLEIEALSSMGISFITEEYLPRKLKEEDWLE
jgi:DNA topoisomerase-6 subunit A